MRLIDADDLKKKENMDYVKISTWDEEKQEFVFGTTYYISPDSVDRAKTVDAVPVTHGYWIGDEDFNWGVFVICSVCNHNFEGRNTDYNYRPYCGAKMDGEEGEDENDDMGRD